MMSETGNGRGASTTVAFTPTVMRFQEERGSRERFQHIEDNGGWRRAITPDLVAFIGQITTCYLATSNAVGQPYVQHRGGPPGFLKVVGVQTIAFADFKGNRQYITTGNLTDNPKAFLFLMDYQNRRRIKLWGRARVVENDLALNARLFPDGYVAEVEQALVFDVDAWDINCPQHIPQMFHTADVAATIQQFQARMRELEKENAALKESLSRLEQGG